MLQLDTFILVNCIQLKWLDVVLFFRPPEKTAFDFDDSMSEVSAKITPRRLPGLINNVTRNK